VIYRQLFLGALTLPILQVDERCADIRFNATQQKIEAGEGEHLPDRRLRRHDF